MGRMLGDSGQDVGQPGLRIDVVQFGSDNQTVHRCGTLATAVGTGLYGKLTLGGVPSAWLPLRVAIKVGALTL